MTLGGFCGRNSQAVVYEIVRQRTRNLTFIDDSPTDQLDILIGAGCIKRVEIAWHGVSIFALARNFRRAIEEAVPHMIEVEDYSNYAAGLRFLAGAMNVPFLPTRSLLGSDIPRYNKRIKIFEDPYGGEPVALVPAASPDVAIIHVQRADVRGNAQIWGHLANDENKARAAKHTVITCEEIVPEEEILRIPNMTTIPFYCVDAVVKALPSVDKRKVLRRRTELLKEFLRPPQREGALKVKKYADTDFVNIVVKKPLYEQLEEKAKRLETTPDKLIYNALLLILKP